MDTKTLITHLTQRQPVADNRHLIEQHLFSAVFNPAINDPGFLVNDPTAAPAGNDAAFLLPTPVISDPGFFHLPDNDQELQQLALINPSIYR